MFKNAVFIFIFIALLFTQVGCKSSKNMDTSLIIPKPVSLKILNGGFPLTESLRILFDQSNPELSKLGEYLSQQIFTYSNIRVKVGNINENPDGNHIRLMIQQTKLSNPEAYLISNQNNQLTITGNQGNGVFYGIQTLIQILRKVNDQYQFSLIEVEDYPRFKWRGMMLDTCRHFFSVEFVKKFIDYLAMYKMNIFHFHLTEDQGWRIEIKKYPLLSQISAFRDETLIGHYRKKPHKFDGKKHGGFFTQDQIKEIVAYAKERYITVVPEIELPGHSGAAIAAYPKLACVEESYQVKTLWGVFEDVYCAGKESTFEFLEDVLTEVSELFPSPYIHIGGDECPKTRWKECEHCQDRILKEGLKDEHELQSYFIKRIEKFLSLKGKRLIGWDEILEGGLAPQATVMSWRGTKGGIEAAQSGHDVVMSPTSHCYFDYYQGDPKTEPLAIGGYLPLGKVYSFEPIPDQLSVEKKKHILGAQANLWTEYIATVEQAEYMIFPRLAALSEVVWTKKELKNWPDFLFRIKNEFLRYKKLGINYSKNTLNRKKE